MHQIHEISNFLLIIFGLALFTALISKYIKLPEPIIGVIAGLILGMVNLPLISHAKDFVTQSVVVQSLVLLLFLPALLGKETLNLPIAHLKENKKPIALLAILGSFLTFLLIGMLMHFAVNYSIAFAFTFAAIMCATDPITVASIFKTTGLNKKVSNIIEGESLFNDGVAVVLFRISSVSILSYVEQGTMGILSAAGEILKVVGIGLTIGFLFGYIGSKIVKQYDDIPKETFLSILVFFGSYATAEAMGASGVIAVVIAGLILGNYGKKHGMSPQTKLGMKSFWDIIASVANSIIFLLVGLEINNVHFNRGWLDITIAIVIVLVSRSISVYISLLFTKGIPSKWQHLINWGGLKGSLSLVLALSLPSQFEMRDELIVITFATVIFSILVQGLTVGPLIKWLDLGIKREGITEYEEKSARYQLVKTALSELKSEYNQSLINKEVYDLKKEKYEEQERQLQKEINQLFERYPEIKEEQLEDLKRLILYRQFDKLKQLESKELIGETISQKIQLEIIEEIEKIDSKNEH